MAQGQQGRGWDAPAPRTPFERTGGFLALGLVLVLGAVALGFLLGRDGGGTDSVSGGGGPAPTNAAGSKAQTELLAKLPTSVYTGCTPTETAQSATATLNCTSAIEGADQLIVSSFADTSAMNGDFENRYKQAYKDGMCSKFNGKNKGEGRTSTWGPNNDQLLACYINENEDAVVLWEYLAPAIQVIAVRDDGNYPELWTYWTKAVKTPLS